MKRQPQFRKQMGRYLLNYMIVLVLVVVACCPLIWESYRLEQENAIRQSSVRLKEGLNQMERTLDNLYTTGTILANDASIRKLSGVRGELAADQYTYMNYGVEQMMRLYLLNNNSCMNIMLFPYNDIYISNEHVSNSFHDYYERFLQADDFSAEEFRDLVFASDQRLTFFSVEELSYYKSGNRTTIYNPLICVRKIEAIGRINDLQFAMVVVFSYEQVMEWMVTEDLRDISLLKLQNADGQTMFRSDHHSELPDAAAGQQTVRLNGESWQLLSEASEVCGLEAVIGFPESIVRSQVMQMIGMLVIYAAAGFAFVIILAVYFSYRQYRPIRRLADLASTELPDENHGKNELEYIGRALSSVIDSKNEYRDRLAQMEARLQSSAVEKLILRGISTEEEADEIKHFLKMPVEFFCVASVYISNGQAQYSPAALRIQDYLQQHLKNTFVCVSSGFQELIFLILLKAEDAPHVLGIKKIFAGMAQALTEEMDIILNSGISAIGNGIHNMSTCYNQALQARRIYSQEMVNSVGVYTLLADHQLSEMMNVEGAQKIYNHLLGSDRAMVGQQLDHLTGKWEKASVPMQLYQQLFYFINHIIWCVVGELSVPRERISLVEYQPSWSLWEMMEVLKNSCFEICDYLDESKKSRNHKLKEDIIRSLQEEYMCCDLTALRVCQKMGISEKYLYQFIKEQTGKTFVGYLEELRMNYALELLLTDHYSNVQIAEASGFGSVNTLYRAFNKYKGMSPAAYKKMLKEKAEMQKG